MPHVVLNGPLTLEDVWLGFEPVQFREGNALFKANECYYSADKLSLLVRCLVVERGFAKFFFLKMTQKDTEISIGLESLGTPERTEAVKRLIGLAGWRLMQAEPSELLVRTNIESYIAPPRLAGEA